MTRDFDRYVVFKMSDIKECLTRDEQKELIRLGRKFQQHRRDTDRPWECLVVEHDWPEYEPTWQAIENRVDGVPNIQESDLYALLGNDTYYMDPPDGGSPSLMTMLKRMAEDAAKYREFSK